MPVNVKSLATNWAIEKLENGKSNLLKIELASFWWNSNCAFIVTKDHSVILFIHERKYGKLEKRNHQFPIFSGNNSREVKTKLNYLKRELNGKNPLKTLEINPSLNLNKLSQWIEKKELIDLLNPSSYIKIFDIVWRKLRNTSSEAYHVGIYLDNRKICHIYSQNPDSQTEAWIFNQAAQRANLSRYWEFFVNSATSASNSQSSSNDLYARISDWEEFLDDSKKVFFLHSIIPFRSDESINKDLKKCLEGNYGRNKYSLMLANCEHFANLIIYEQDYSSQVENFGWVSSLLIKLNRGKSTAVHLLSKSDELAVEKERDLQEEEELIFKQLIERSGQ